MIALAPRLDDLSEPHDTTPLDGPPDGADLEASDPAAEDSADLNAILHDYLRSSLPLAEIAAIHGLSLTRLAGVLDSAPVRRVLDTLERASARRAAIIAAEARPEALARLRQLVQTPVPLDEPHTHKHDELARKAAVRVLAESGAAAGAGSGGRREHAARARLWAQEKRRAELRELRPTAGWGAVRAGV